MTIQGYGFTFNGHGTFTPDGKCADGLTRADVERSNREIEAKEIEAIKAGSPSLFLYVKLDEPCNHPSMRHCGASGSISTWLGNPLTRVAQFGPRRYVGFGHNTYRRSVRCELFGRKYHGWYYESSGDYCRLNLSK